MGEEEREDILDIENLESAVEIDAPGDTVNTQEEISSESEINEPEEEVVDIENLESAVEIDTPDAAETNFEDISSGDEIVEQEEVQAATNLTGGPTQVNNRQVDPYYILTDLEMVEEKIKEKTEKFVKVLADAKNTINELRNEKNPIKRATLKAKKNRCLARLKRLRNAIEIAEKKKDYEQGKEDLDSETVEKRNFYRNQKTTALLRQQTTVDRLENLKLNFPGLVTGDIAGIGKEFIDDYNTLLNNYNSYEAIINFNQQNLDKLDDIYDQRRSELKTEKKEAINTIKENKNNNYRDGNSLNSNTVPNVNETNRMEGNSAIPNVNTVNRENNSNVGNNIGNEENVNTSNGTTYVNNPNSQVAKIGFFRGLMNRFKQFTERVSKNSELKKQNKEKEKQDIAEMKARNKRAREAEVAGMKTAADNERKEAFNQQIAQEEQVIDSFKNFRDNLHVPDEPQQAENKDIEKDREEGKQGSTPSPRQQGGSEPAD